MNVGSSGVKRLTRDFALDDQPAWSPDGARIAFVSTREPASVPGQAWNAIYVMNADGSHVHRMTPLGVTDYSPAWSPRGDRIVCASGSGVTGGTDLYAMKPDGTGRRLIIKDGGWPTFAADGMSLFFHSGREGNWGIWRVNLDGSGLERVTPGKIEAYTPRAAAAGHWLVVAVERGAYRQIGLVNLATGQITDLTTDPTDHWNPAITPDGRQVVYHKVTPGLTTPDVDFWGAPPGTGLSVLRVDGVFPAFSPDGKRLVLNGNGFSGLDVMNTSGSERRTVYSGTSEMFAPSWSPEGDRIAFTQGATFAGSEARVDIATIRPDGSGYRELTSDSSNNSFPSFSPDGKELVFRSSRDGPKNLYVMNSDGTGLRRLTDGQWTDTMPDWSPTGEWIVFASDRGGEFELWLINPVGSKLHKLIGHGGLNTHPRFSPDGQWVVFTSQRAGYSAEEISMPHQFQPYGELFVIGVDGSRLTRLTHNGFEDGTPAWGPIVYR
jgi:Tol biopolymer transport system component